MALPPSGDASKSVTGGDKVLRSVSPQITLSLLSHLNLPESSQGLRGAQIRGILKGDRTMDKKSEKAFEFLYNKIEELENEKELWNNKIDVVLRYKCSHCGESEEDYKSLRKRCGSGIGHKANIKTLIRFRCNICPDTHSEQLFKDKISAIKHCVACKRRKDNPEEWFTGKRTTNPIHHLRGRMWG